jgi:hypothetical protein
MTLHWEAKHPKEMVALILVIGVAALLAAAILLARENRARGDPALTTSRTQVSDGAQGRTQDVGALQFLVFTSPAGDYRFEAPGAWKSPIDPEDPTQEAFFVGPVDQAHHVVVFLTVSRYPQGGKTASIESMIAQLRLDRGKQVLANEILLVDQRPARFVTIHEPAAGILDFDLRESFVLFEREPHIFVLEYVSSPEVYAEYRPIFDRLVTSFHFRDSTP